MLERKLFRDQEKVKNKVSGMVKNNIDIDNKLVVPTELKFL